MLCVPELLACHMECYQLDVSVDRSDCWAVIANGDLSCGLGLITCHSSSCRLLTDVHAGMGPQGYAWPPPNMMPPNMQTDPGFRPSVAMDPSMIPPYYGTGVPQQQQWQPQSMPVSQGLPQAQSQSEQAPSQQVSAVQQQ